MVLGQTTVAANKIALLLWRTGDHGLRADQDRGIEGSIHRERLPHTPDARIGSRGLVAGTTR